MDFSDNTTDEWFWGNVTKGTSEKTFRKDVAAYVTQGIMISQQLNPNNLAIRHFPVEIYENEVEHVKHTDNGAYEVPLMVIKINFQLQQNEASP